MAGNITRIASENYIVPNTDFTIPKGMRIYIPIFAIHHDERFYTSPEEFNPDREFPSNAFLPFGDGKYSLSSIITPTLSDLFCCFLFIFRSEEMHGLSFCGTSSWRWSRFTFKEFQIFNMRSHSNTYQILNYQKYTCTK